jgi:hypothetical protein
VTDMGAPTNLDGRNDGLAQIDIPEASTDARRSWRRRTILSHRSASTPRRVYLQKTALNTLFRSESDALIGPTFSECCRKTSAPDASMSGGLAYVGANRRQEVLGVGGGDTLLLHLERWPAER